MGNTALRGISNFIFFEKLWIFVARDPILLEEYVDPDEDEDYLRNQVDFEKDWRNQVDSGKNTSAAASRIITPLKKLYFFKKWAKSLEELNTPKFPRLINPPENEFEQRKIPIIRRKVKTRGKIGEVRFTAETGESASYDINNVARDK